MISLLRGCVFEGLVLGVVEEEGLVLCCMDVVKEEGFVFDASKEEGLVLSDMDVVKEEQGFVLDPVNVKS